MKKITILFCLLIGLTTAAQELFVELGKVNSSFDFTNSQGVSLDNLQSVTDNYAGIGFKHPFFDEKLTIALGLNYNSYGATGSDRTLDNSFEWEVDYIGINLNWEYQAITVKDFTFFLKAGISYEFLATGTQRINNQSFSLVGVEEFDNNAIFYRGGAGVGYPLFDGGTLYAQYLYGKSFALKDDSPSSNEELKITSHMFGIGLTVDLFKDKKETTNTTEDTID
ncbi:MAG: hypothetical protein CL867_10300 [Cytophagaceae bacterium]|nr:hypothetical protein [Cytophagaceae bacterium]